MATSKSIKSSSSDTICKRAKLLDLFCQLLLLMFIRFKPEKDLSVEQFPHRHCYVLGYIFYFIIISQSFIISGKTYAAEDKAI